MHSRDLAYLSYPKPHASREGAEIHLTGSYWGHVDCYYDSTFHTSPVLPLIPQHFLTPGEFNKNKEFYQMATAFSAEGFSISFKI